MSDIIINDNLKLLQINYLARNVDVFFSFPSRSRCTCNNLWQDCVDLGFPCGLFRLLKQNVSISIVIFHIISLYVFIFCVQCIIEVL